GEERIRPRKGTFYCLDGARTSLHELGMFMSHEYWINIPAQKADDPSQQTRATDVKDRKYAPPLLSRVGVLKLDADFHAGSLRTVKAVILSEAQYLGNEPTPDVLGYPLYNIMLVRRVGKFEGHSFAERIGTGKIYK
ncbi:hypothetical protein P153DRAFT_276144, partial [Dothidotthia symphoricarpi CBS 119687]